MGRATDRSRVWSVSRQVQAGKRSIEVIALAASLFASTAPHAAERLSALSKTAMSITGDIQFSPTRIVFANKVALKLARLATAVPFKSYFDDGVAADLFQILTPHDPLLLNGNRLCGSGKPLSFLLVWRSKTAPADWTIAPSTAETAPLDASGICGTYSYRGR